jgi:Ala-tRNA(Pro) deacylase
MPVDKLKKFLSSQNVKYEVVKHKEVYTAQEVAAAAHISGKRLAKTVMLKIDNEIVMAVLPASHKVDFKHLKQSAGVKKVELATEKEFKNLFPDCEVGAMPPFGNLYDIPIFFAESLVEEMEIAFCAGSHTELIRMAVKDFVRLVQPKVFDFSFLG